MFNIATRKEIFGDGNLATYCIFSSLDREDALKFQKLALELQEKYKSDKKLDLFIMARDEYFPSEYERDDDENVNVSISIGKNTKKKPKRILENSESLDGILKMLDDLEREEQERWDWDKASLMIFTSESRQRVYEMTFDIGDKRIKTNVDYFFYENRYVDLEEVVKQKIKVVE